MSKITVIGTGSVGATIAYTLTYSGIASEIVLIDINTKKAFGEALDIRQSTPFCTPAVVYDGTYEDAKGSDIVVITSGVARKPGQTRLELAQVNINILKSIIPEITKSAPDATYIIVSNPVDILTYVFCKLSGIPEDRVIGSGTMLDTSRLRTALADEFKINPQNVHAHVLGEHGDSSFIPWSCANISGIPVADYADSVSGDAERPVIDFAATETFVRKSGGVIIENKGATFNGVSVCVCHLCECLMKNRDTALPVSTMMNGEYGISDVCLSVLCNIGNMRVHNKVLLPLNDEEVAALKHSADCLNNIITSTEI